MGLLLTALAIAVRLVWVLVVPTRPVGDFAMYLESARYLVEHRGLDAEFIYMPGYVYLAAAIYAFGGGLLAVKMIGVAAGGLATAAVYGTARALFGRGRAIAAGLLCALWPAGVAVSSVTGTDMPAAALLGLAVWLLVRYAGDRPMAAPILFGLGMGLAAYVRAVALPLAALAGLHFRARGARWRHVATRTGLACLVAFLVLLPWGLRNRHRYGEFFLTDSHGGHTALVGANPNSEGTYSRSLNRLFAEGTGYALFSSPHRESDRVAYALAKRWTAFSPGYALGLLAAKADRLLGRERSLLYWPLYRQSVLPPGGWFDVHRAGVERVVDGSWALFVGLMAIGIVVAAARRNWPALSLLPLPLGLAGLYTLYFAEVRYQLAIVVLLLPFAGEGLGWLASSLASLVRPPAGGGRRRLAIEAGVVAAALVSLFAGWSSLMSAGERLRARDRWGVCVCDIAGRKRLCEVRATQPPSGTAPSPVRGVWDGFGLSLVGPRAAAGFEVELPPGRYAISLTLESAKPRVAATIALSADGSSLAHASWPVDACPITLRGTLQHEGEKLRVDLSATRENSSGTDGGPTIWISAIEVEPDRA